LSTNPAPTSATPPPLSFEAALHRLEEILEQINSGATSLEESILLYEEADKLIALCSNRLNEAEQKVEILIKNRQGEVVMNAEQKPSVQEFSPSSAANPKGCNS